VRVLGVLINLFYDALGSLDYVAWNDGNINEE
jgi:hypothetical protein